ncbi:MAG: hypothetical protein WA919_20425 [Coleofasciculaceae cyanobacterium]
MEPNSKFRKVNASLDKQPKIGPFPADQFLPWIAIAGISYYLFKIALGLSWIWTGILAAWGMSTWWILTGSHSWRFLSKFIPVPNWVRGTLCVGRESGVGSRESGRRIKRG